MIEFTKIQQIKLIINRVKIPNYYNFLKKLENHIIIFLNLVLTKPRQMKYQQRVHVKYDNN